MFNQKFCDWDMLDIGFDDTVNVLLRFPTTQVVDSNTVDEDLEYCEDVVFTQNVPGSIFVAYEPNVFPKKEENKVGRIREPFFPSLKVLKF